MPERPKEFDVTISEPEVVEPELPIQAAMQIYRTDGGKGITVDHKCVVRGAWCGWDDKGDIIYVTCSGCGTSVPIHPELDDWHPERITQMEAEHD